MIKHFEAICNTLVKGECQQIVEEFRSSTNKECDATQSDNFIATSQSRKVLPYSKLISRKISLELGDASIANREVF